MQRWLQRLAVVVVIVVLPMLVLRTCSGETADVPPGTVGVVPPPDTPETLLPLATGTSVLLETTSGVPPDALFGGNLCTSLGVDDLRAAASLVSPSGTDPADALDDDPGPSVTAAATDVSVLDEGPVSTVAVSADACRFVVRDPVRYSVLVRVRTVFDLKSPELSDGLGGTLVADALPGIGEEAIGIDRSTTYEVVVKVERGWFSVSAPARDVAIRLATAAVSNCCG